MPGPSTCPHSINHQNVPKYIFMSQICFLNSRTRLWLKFDYKVQSFRFLHLPQPTCPESGLLTPTPCAPVKTVPAALKAATVSGKLRRRAQPRTPCAHQCAFYTNTDEHITKRQIDKNARWANKQRRGTDKKTRTI